MLSLKLFTLTIAMAALLPHQTSCSSTIGLRSLQNTRKLSNLRRCSFEEVKNQAERRGIQLKTSEADVETMCVAAAEERAGG